jgi:hypothetical protein
MVTCACEIDRPQVEGQTTTSETASNAVSLLQSLDELLNARCNETCIRISRMLDFALSLVVESPDQSRVHGQFFVLDVTIQPSTQAVPYRVQQSAESCPLAQVHTPYLSKSKHVRLLLLAASPNHEVEP